MKFGYKNHKLLVLYYNNNNNKTKPRLIIIIKLSELLKGEEKDY